GRVELWAIDSKDQVWTIWQTSPGGDWTGWVGPNWNGAPGLSQIVASQQGGDRGAQLWGTTPRDVLLCTFQETSGGDWSPWTTASWSNAVPVIELAAAQLWGSGPVQLWVLDEKQELWGIAQTSPGGSWGAWVGPNWNKAPRGLQVLAASPQGGIR